MNEKKRNVKRKWVPVFLATMMVLPNGLSAYAQDAKHPFPQHVTYQKGVIKPNHVSQNQLDADTKKAYDQWKTNYLVKHPGIPTQSYVKFDESGSTVSEAHGYGMLILVYMAGHDPEAKVRFDEMYRYFKAHPSAIDNNLMSWKQVKSGTQMVDADGTDSATDGDMDIAYALLLADKQWGSNGEINYLSASKSMIHALMEKTVNQSEGIIKLGDWASDSDATYGKATRSSDWMMNHVRTFHEATGDERWNDVLNRTYAINQTLFKNHSPNTGLMPDFAVKSGSVYMPVSGTLLENSTDGQYSYNASRTPWRLATDYLISGETRALPSLKKTNEFMQSASKGIPENVYSGYALNGTPSVTWGGESTFLAPLAVSAMIDSTNQPWLNKLWIQMNQESEGYFSDTIEMLCMIIVSGNWWTADSVVSFPSPAKPQPEPQTPPALPIATPPNSAPPANPSAPSAAVEKDIRDVRNALNKLKKENEALKKKVMEQEQKLSKVQKLVQKLNQSLASLKHRLKYFFN